MLLFLAYSGFGQEKNVRSYSNFPVIITLQFHGFAMPFQDLRSNFSNIGIGIGTEFSYNGKQNFVHQVSAVWYRNRTIGNGLLFYTQPVWRPGSRFYGELKVGAGYLISWRPAASFKPVKGEWVDVKKRGKGMFTIPIGVGLGYNVKNSDQLVSSFATYQFMIVSGYNQSVPLVPETLVQAGLRVHKK
jgi:hypothetical protein